MPVSPRYSFVRWSVSAVKKEAAKYKSRAEFKRGCAGAYEYARANGLLTSLCSKMDGDKQRWHLFEVMCIAVKYSDVNKFRVGEPLAYSFSSKNKILPTVCAHMSKGYTDWTKELVLEEAGKHQSRGMFLCLAPGAYKHADKYGYMDEACAHMPAPEFGFSKEKSANLYHLSLSLSDGTTLYKLGITNRRVEDRIRGMGIPSEIVVSVLDVIGFDSGRDARMAEKRLHRKFKQFRYGGERFLKNGNTELFTAPLIGG